jgi:hypothetical protein
MIEYAPANKDSLILEAMKQRYRNVFGTDEGVLVLGDILRMCHFGVPLNSEEERVEYNVGVAIARMCGIMGLVDNLVGIRGG